MDEIRQVMLDNIDSAIKNINIHSDSNVKLALERILILLEDLCDE